MEFWQNYKDFILAIGGFIVLTAITSFGLYLTSPEETPPSTLSDALESLPTPNPELESVALEAPAPVVSTPSQPSPFDSIGATQATSTSASPKPATASASLLTGYGSLKRDGQVVMYRLTFPVAGGTVTGTVSGACKGKILGEYDRDTEVVEGDLTGTCTIDSQEIAGAGTFSGVIRPILGEGTGTYEGQAGEYTDKGAWQISFSPLSP